ncbi:MAG: porphobilinogen synthase [Candidatus Tectomicrobia bacterium]|nr:porphobilinogen synthase [Candidatus Tectomicrobia bacterium]
MHFPTYRPRRLRQSDALRRMVRETSLAIDDLILPLFVEEGENLKREISSMPGNYRFSIDRLLEELKDVSDLGIPAVMFFGIPQHKDEVGSEAYAEHGIIQRAVAAVKNRFPALVVITDVCLCEYTSHGHCGVVEGERVLNDPSLELLARAALSHVQAGADMVAPSDMMDGRVGAIRTRLDEHGFSDTPIMAYAAKYASSFYGPFREAADSTPQFGDRRAYQMDPGNAEEALREVELDIAEGADIVMVKPALPFLDIIYRVKQRFNRPLAAYNVSGEFAMLQAGARLGWLDGERVMWEALLSIKRAGADMILTYYSKQVARALQRPL